MYSFLDTDLPQPGQNTGAFREGSVEVLRLRPHVMKRDEYLCNSVLIRGLTEAGISQRITLASSAR